MVPEDNSNTSSKQDLVTQKVIILYICEKLDSLNKQELMHIALESMYMDYFQFSKVLDELIEEDLIAATLRKSESQDKKAQARYSLAPKGLVVLDTLRSNIPNAVTKYINELLVKSNQELDRLESVISDIDLLEDGSYNVKLSLKEKQNPYLSIEIKVPNRDMAKSVEKNWHGRAGAIYTEILQILYDQSGTGGQNSVAEKDKDKSE